MFSRSNSLTFFNLFEFEQNVRSQVYPASRISNQETKRREIFHFLFKPIVMNKKIVKQVAGIDVAQNELVVCLGRMYDDWMPELYRHKVFSNNQKGFMELVSWVKAHSMPAVQFRFVMEATGVYH